METEVAGGCSSAAFRPTRVFWLQVLRCSMLAFIRRSSPIWQSAHRSIRRVALGVRLWRHHFGQVIERYADLL
jgi:hypothetical protein